MRSERAPLGVDTAHGQQARDGAAPPSLRLTAARSGAGGGHGGARGTLSLPWYVAHGVATLAAHGSGANGPATAARVWVHALQAVCSPAQWAVYLPVARAAAGEAVWRGMLAEAPGLEGPGLLAAAA